MKKVFYFFYNKFYLFCEKFFKIHITRVHFYSPIPKTSELDGLVYLKKYSSLGIKLNIKEQLKLLSSYSSNYSLKFIPKKNEGLSLVDSFMLYCFISKTKPKKIVEIGRGFSTKIIIEAIEKNLKNEDVIFYSIDPYIKTNDYKNKTNIKFINKRVQDIPLSFFKDVDFLFIDSSHVSKIDSDVNYEVLEILPCLKKNSIIHWHDIYFPLNYPKQNIESTTRNMYWNESYIVQSFMLFNNSYEILYAGKYLQVNYPKFLKKNFPFFLDKHSLSSFYIKKIK